MKFRKIKIELYIFFIKLLKQRVNSIVGLENGFSIYRNASLSKLYDEDEEKKSIGIKESLYGKDRLLKESAFNLFLEGKCSEKTENQVYEILSKRTQSSKKTNLDENLITLIDVAKNKQRYVWKMYAILFVVITSIMITMVITGLIVVFVLKEKIWGITIGSAGLLQFFTFIWYPVSKLQEGAINTTQIEIILYNFGERWKSISEMNGTGNRNRELKRLTKDVIKSLKDIVKKKQRFSRSRKHSRK